MDVKPVVIVTGFGPFGNYKINASWESVKLLSTMNLEEELGIQLVLKEIPVSYDYVTKNVPDLWKVHNPLLVIHVGVSCIATDITLEQCANKSGYVRDDVDNCIPSEGHNCVGNENKIVCQLDLQKICEVINSANLEVSTSVSENAGRYLCEYIYYTSLCMNSGRTLFIHVPELDRPYSARQIAEGLKAIIKTILENLEHCRCIDNDKGNENSLQRLNSA